jgi:vacuolar-type H+-ATPase subunit E/Vma4
MEQLQSTNILQREILEDARKKAQRILKTASAQAAQADKDWEKRTEDALLEIRKRQDKKLENARKEIMARLPLDKRRARLKTIDGLLRSAARAYLEGLSREKLLSLLRAEFSLRAAELEPPTFDTADLRVLYRGLSPEELEAVLKNTLPEGRINYSSAESAAGNFPAFSVDSGAVRVSVSAEGALEALLEEKRGELAAALLGGEVLDA